MRLFVEEFDSLVEELVGFAFEEFELFVVVAVAVLVEVDIDRLLVVGLDSKLLVEDNSRLQVLFVRMNFVEL